MRSGGLRPDDGDYFISLHLISGLNPLNLGVFATVDYHHLVKTRTPFPRLDQEGNVINKHGRFACNAFDFDARNLTLHYRVDDGF